MNIQLTDQTVIEQIGQIADQGRQTPEQVVTEALELYIRQLPADPLPNEVGRAIVSDEAEPVSLEAAMEKTKSVLRDLADHADTIMAESEPGRRSGFLEAMNRLTKRIDAAGNEADLIAIANIVQDLTIEIPDVTRIMFTPEDEPPPRHFRLENPNPVTDGDGHIEDQKMALREVFNSSFKRIDRAWRDFPRPVPPNVSLGAKEPPWDLIKKLKDDPSWDDFFEEIERERDKDWVWLGGEAE